jgi:hypothetical protein
MRLPRVPRWVFVLVAVVVAPVLLVVVAETREFVDRRITRFTHFNTLDAAKEEKGDVSLAASGGSL